eukprot:Gregarina_sp_Pseudo_9__5415@NODE_668_length_2396_cov_8_599491_g631_i0_p1_GENE_NODE_668_length_2396_cov_8_599491_g631_i0NODE_668_length_2396_cov_8_599491_g631_i0_p1_ORF_typecomplete_len479_score56_06TLD/PF07534_16/9_3e23_NODE_668_length_2396_cov_8_599491_g631_i05862022
MPFRKWNFLPFCGTRMGNAESDAKRGPNAPSNGVSALQRCLAHDFRSGKDAIQLGLFPHDPRFQGLITARFFSDFANAKCPNSNHRKQLELFEQWLFSLDSVAILNALWSAVKSTFPNESNETNLRNLLTYLYKLSLTTTLFKPKFNSANVNIEFENRHKEITNSESLESLFQDLFPSLLHREMGLSATFKHLLQQSVRVPTPSLDLPSRVFSDEQFWLLSNADLGVCQIMAPCTPTLLYSLAKMSQSWVKFVEKVDQYSAPVLIGIKTKTGHVLGAYIDGGLRESGSKYFGSPQTFLFSLCPTYFLCRASGNSDNFTILNLKANFVPTGLGFGGEEANHRLLIKSDLKTLVVTYSDKTYRPGELVDLKDEDGSLMFRKEVEMEEFEVWGLGDERDLKAQLRAKEREEDLKADARQVDRAKFADNAFDREFLVGGGGGTKPGGDRAGEAEAIRDQYLADKRAKELERRPVRRTSSASR